MGDAQEKEVKGSAHLEQHITTDVEDLKSAQVGDRVDDEVQKYAAMGRVEVDEPTSRRLKRLIDRRVLTIMVFTYLVQALDKGTLSFTSIMGILDDAHLHGTEVSFSAGCSHWNLLTRHSILGCRRAYTSQSWWLNTLPTGLSNEFQSQNILVVTSLYGGLFWHCIQQSRALEVSWHAEFCSAYLKLVHNQASFAFPACGINVRSRHRPLLSGRLTPIIWVTDMLITLGI